MPKPINVPLSPEEEAAIQAIVADETEPEHRITLEKRLRAVFQNRANDEAEDRRIYRDAIKLAEAEGYGDPEGFAQARTSGQKLLRATSRQHKSAMDRLKGRAFRADAKALRLIESSSKSARPSLRRLPQHDSQYVEIVGEADKRGVGLHDPSVRRELEKKLQGYSLPHWEKTTIPLKVLAMSVEAHRRGAITINLHVSNLVREAALDSPRGPVSFIQNRIRSSFKKAFPGLPPLEFWCVAEMGLLTRFHIHGAVVLPTDADADVIKRIESALREAGGEWADPKGVVYQVRTTELVKPFGWAAYVCKQMNSSGRVIDRKLMASTSVIRRLSSAAWDDLRRGLPRG